MSTPEDTHEWAGTIYYNYVTQKAKVFKEFDDGLKRISNLFAVYDYLASDDDFNVGSDDPARYADHLSSTAEDVLRAIVVLLHALMETYLRGNGREWLRVKVKYESISVPYHGKKDPNEKFGLNDLRSFLGKTVDDVFADSIDAYLATKSFTNIGAIMDFLRELGIKTSVLTPYRPILLDIIKRRNLIAHSADIIDNGILPLSRDEVWSWVKGVADFLSDVQNVVIFSRYFIKELEQKVNGYPGAEDVLKLVEDNRKIVEEMIASKKKV